MAPQNHFYAIAGAGITGMTLALALAKHGARVTVLERNPHIQETGAGLQISPNASRILQNLALGDELKSHGFEPQGLEIYPFASKKPVQTLRLGAAMKERFAAPYYVLHRADLAQMLYRACKRFANIDIRFSVSDFDVTEADAGTRISFKVDGREETLKTNAFIGADGVHSKTRTHYLNGPLAADTHCVAWRTLIPIKTLSHAFSTTHTSLLWSPGAHAVVYPLPHRNQFNIALFSPAPKDGNQSSPLPCLPRKITKDQRFAAILSATNDWTYWPLFSVSTDIWHKGNIAIAGDAAHAMLPFQAQGAAMGIEDAMVLANRLLESATPQQAFAKYEAARLQRTSRVAKTSASNANIFHMHAPLSWARDFALRLLGPTNHLSRLSWLYAYESN